MACSTAELRQKDVIATKDGRKLGYITDFEIDASSGRICTIIVTSCVGGFGFRQSREEYRIPWDKIACIGEDTVLVSTGEWSAGCETCCDSPKKRKNGWLWW